MRALRSGATIVLALVALGACQLSYTGGARVVSPAAIGPGWYKAAATPVVRQQHETDCGLAALAMVAGTWGRQWSVAELIRQLPPTERGVKLGALRDLAQARGFEAYAIKGTAKDLERELQAGRPVVLGLILPYDQKRNASHYEVAVAINPRDGTVVTIDPATGHWRERSSKVLDLEWKAAGFATLVITADRRASTPGSARSGPAGRDRTDIARPRGVPTDLGLRVSVAGAWPSSSSTTRR